MPRAGTLFSLRRHYGRGFRARVAHCRTEALIPQFQQVGLLAVEATAINYTPYNRHIRPLPGLFHALEVASRKAA